MTRINPRKLCVLITVYHPYRWVAPFTWRLIDTLWQDHPPVFFCGLTAKEAGDLPNLPCRQPGLPRVWAEFAFDAARELQERGFELCYFLLEDHPPLGRCHARHLNETLPTLMETLPASYIGLMGWDNRRFATRAGPLLPRSLHRLMHLVKPNAPRFHLHPSLFRVETLVSCLAALRRSEKPNPWGFEKLCDKPDAPLPDESKRACYQICGEELAENATGPALRLLRNFERAFYHKAMNLFAPLNRIGLGMRFWDALGFDNFFYRGPYPMFYSGVMSRGRVNPFLIRHLRGIHHPIAGELLAAARRQGAA